MPGPNRRFEQPPAAEDHVVPHSPSCPSAWAGTVDWSVTGRLAGGSIPPTILTLFALYILASRAPTLRP